MNRALFRLSLVCLVMFVLLLLNINYVQGFEADSLANKPGNIRTFTQQFTYQRGSIIADGDGGAGTVIAQSQLIKGTDQYQRNYPDGPEYAPVTGFDSIYGATATESAYNSDLAGTAPGLAVHNVISLVTGKPKQGADVYLTISPKAQQAAYQALESVGGGHNAAAVAIDPSTGAILAMASVPTYDPNQLTSLNGSTFDQADKALLNNPSQPLLNRAINQTLPPGSSFKIITASAALSTGTVANTQTNVPSPQPLQLPNGNLLSNDDGESCGDGNPPLIEAFYVSCDTTFAKLGIKLGSSTLKSYAEKFGWNASLDLPMQVSPSEMPLVSDLSLTGMSAIGQYNDTATPLQEAMDAAAIANNGTLMRPYLLNKVVAPDLQSVQSTQPSVLSQAVTSQVAGEVGSMMVQVTTNPGGTAFATANPSVAGVEIAGKTGTAQNGPNNSGLDDAVFTCYAPANNPKIAVGVMVQGGGYGADAAAPIAVKIIQAYLGV
jgi:penicillin-binding protein A